MIDPAALRRMVGRTLRRSLARCPEVRVSMQIGWGKLVRALRYLKPWPKPLRLHLGCGSVHIPGMLNVDGLPAPHVDLVRAVDDLSPFSAESAVLIYASHVLEHFPHHRVQSIIREWCRVLQPGGILRLAVPDFDALLRVYHAEGDRLDWIMGPLMGGQDYRFNFHQCHFNRSLLTYMLLTNGFREVRDWQPGQDQFTTDKDWSARPFLVEGRSYQVSLNLEAVK
jgi:predicted SAM-dependent methyltransferase